MNEELEKAIGTLTKLITDQVKSDDALRYTQAALNLAHVASVLLQNNQVKT
jgi:hypothetical protein